MEIETMIIVDIKNCSACGQNHQDMIFKYRPNDFLIRNNKTYKYSARCPYTFEWVYLRYKEENE